MIRETWNGRGAAVVSSDRWHVLRARWTGNGAGRPLYQRTVESEHPDRTEAAAAATALLATFAVEMAGRTRETRDQILVRRPGFRSLKLARRTQKRRS